MRARPKNTGSIRRNPGRFSIGFIWARLPSPPTIPVSTSSNQPPVPAAPRTAPGYPMLQNSEPTKMWQLRTRRPATQLEPRCPRAPGYNRNPKSKKILQLMQLSLSSSKSNGRRWASWSSCQSERSNGSYKKHRTYSKISL